MIVYDPHSRTFRQVYWVRKIHLTPSKRLSYRNSVVCVCDVKRHTAPLSKALSSKTSSHGAWLFWALRLTNFFNYCPLIKPVSRLRPIEMFLPICCWVCLMIPCSEMWERISRSGPNVHWLGARRLHMCIVLSHFTLVYRIFSFHLHHHK
jgi:hypothetical protein